MILYFCIQCGIFLENPKKQDYWQLFVHVFLSTTKLFINTQTFLTSIIHFFLFPLPNIGIYKTKNFPHNFFWVFFGCPLRLTAIALGLNKTLKLFCTEFTRHWSLDSPQFLLRYHLLVPHSHKDFTLQKKFLNLSL